MSYRRSEENYPLAGSGEWLEVFADKQLQKTAADPNNLPGSMPSTPPAPTDTTAPPVPADTTSATPTSSENSIDTLGMRKFLDGLVLPVDSFRSPENQDVINILIRKYNLNDIFLTKDNMIFLRKNIGLPGPKSEIPLNKTLAEIERESTLSGTGDSEVATETNDGINPEEFAPIGYPQSTDEKTLFKSFKEQLNDLSTTYQNTKKVVDLINNINNVLDRYSIKHAKTNKTIIIRTAGETADKLTELIRQLSQQAPEAFEEAKPYLIELNNTIKQIAPADGPTPVAGPTAPVEPTAPAGPSTPKSKEFFLNTYNQIKPQWDRIKTQLSENPDANQLIKSIESKVYEYFASNGIREAPKGLASSKNQIKTAALSDDITAFINTISKDPELASAISDELKQLQGLSNPANPAAPGAPADATAQPAVQGNLAKISSELKSQLNQLIAELQKSVDSYQNIISTPIGKQIFNKDNLNTINVVSRELPNVTKLIQQIQPLLDQYISKTASSTDRIITAGVWDTIKGWFGGNKADINNASPDVILEMQKKFSEGFFEAAGIVQKSLDGLLKFWNASGSDPSMKGNQNAINDLFKSISNIKVVLPKVASEITNVPGSSQEATGPSVTPPASKAPPGSAGVGGGTASIGAGSGGGSVKSTTSSPTEAKQNMFNIEDVLRNIAVAFDDARRNRFITDEEYQASGQLIDQLIKNVGGLKNKKISMDDDVQIESFDDDTELVAEDAKPVEPKFYSV